jgi:eukaryotic-like serine/threonine-protein kinase
MDTERWQRVERIYHDAMECEAAQRGPLLERACEKDPSLRDEVESLLHYGELSNQFLEKPAIEVMAQALAEDLRDIETEKTDRMVGARIAQYRIVEKLGAGGMGDVYRATRADDQFEKQVAIKLVRRGSDTESVEIRFRRERQILAGFDHENIARLLDGGTTEEGHPYFVMELVEGKPVDEYCDESRLGISARLDLFRSVCSAVQYAHQRLVVHRDIKPTNILVTADGIPKLLDFGIATILSSETLSPEVEQTETALRIMTPQFASPEQLHGHIITTATDVYSLGVVLYKLLTGVMPYRIGGNAHYDVAHAICETSPDRPSSAVHRSLSGTQSEGKLGDRSALIVASAATERMGHASSRAAAELISSNRGTTPERLCRILAGDLDQIILKALRKEPERRYASVRDFAEDLRSYLRGLPVSARSDTFGYRAGKFVRRNRYLLAATAAFTLLVFLGVTVILREAQVARVQEARAERRFNDVRSLANSLLFEIHDSIRDLPGSTAARKLLVDRALLYLDSLAQESSGTPGLQRELATAYERVGDVQGNPYYANLGDTSGAIASYRKALNIMLALADTNRGSYEDRTTLVEIYMDLGIALEAAGDFTASLDALQHSYPIAKRLVRERPNNPQAQEQLAGVCFILANGLADIGNIPRSLDYYRQSATIREAIAGGPAEFQNQVQRRLAGVYGYMAGDLNAQGDPGSAVSLQGKAHAILVKLVTSDPKNARLQQFLLENEYWSAYYMAQEGLIAQALPHFRTALAGYRQLTKIDRHDVLALRYAGKCYVGIAGALAALGKPGQGIQTARTAIQIFDSLAVADHGDNFFKPVDLAYAQSTLADAYRQSALAAGSSTARLEAWKSARLWYQQSLNTWLPLKYKGQLGIFDADQPNKVAQQVAFCDAQLAKRNVGGK